MLTFGTCRLCLKEAELQDSHLLPKALYRMIGRASNRAHPDTVQITRRGQRKSSEQAVSPLLCWDCEQRLNKNGEDWVLRNCYRGRGVFRLRSDVRKRLPFPDASAEIYEAIEEEREKIGYFASSILWRAALCDWICRGERYERLGLGRYEEEIRKYLNGNARSPDRFGVMVVLSPSLGSLCGFPIYYREGSYHCYRFHIPGMTFVLTVGGGVAGDLDRVSVLQPPYPLLVTDYGDRRVQDEMMLVGGNVPPRGYQAPLVDGTEKG
jgi:hypothetical protein